MLKGGKSKLVEITSKHDNNHPQNSFPHSNKKIMQINVNTKRATG